MDELARLNEQLRTGEFEVRKPPKPQVKIPKEYERAQVELEMARKRIRAMEREMQPWTARRMGSEFINTLRTLKATADMSGALRQGFILSARHPVAAAKSFGKAAQAMFSKYKAEQIDHAIRSAEHAPH